MYVGSLVYGYAGLCVPVDEQVRPEVPASLFFGDEQAGATDVFRRLRKHALDASLPHFFQDVADDIGGVLPTVNAIENPGLYGAQAGHTDLSASFGRSVKPSLSKHRSSCCGTLEKCEHSTYTYAMAARDPEGAYGS
ncbi:hypothetical protein MRX96_054197 [Rhipicephalus microplus]